MISAGLQLNLDYQPAALSSIRYCNTLESKPLFSDELLLKNSIK